MIQTDDSAYPSPPCDDAHADNSDTDPTPTTVHRSVMPDEVLASLDPQSGQTIVDGTLGGGGHTALLADLVGPDGLVVAIDRDADAVAGAERRFAGRPVKPFHGNFCNLPEVLTTLGLGKVDGVLLDLGLSSDQLADHDRGFSFHAEGDLDLRFDTSRGEPAWRLVNRLSEKHLADILYQYGEERFSRRIARRLVAARQKSTIRSAREFADIVRAATPKLPNKGRRPRIDAATRTFQALRIAVNQELHSLEVVLRRLPDCLRLGGVVVIISFHSLEDRLVKNAFRDHPNYEIASRKPQTPSPVEVSTNPRSRSARLRVAKVVADDPY